MLFVTTILLLSQGLIGLSYVILEEENGYYSSWRSKPVQPQMNPWSWPGVTMFPFNFNPFTWWQSQQLQESIEMGIMRDRQLVMFDLIRCMVEEDEKDMCKKMVRSAAKLFLEPEVLLEKPILQVKPVTEVNSDKCVEDVKTEVKPLEIINLGIDSSATQEKLSETLTKPVVTTMNIKPLETLQEKLSEVLTKPVVPIDLQETLQEKLSEVLTKPVVTTLGTSMDIKPQEVLQEKSPEVLAKPVVTTPETLMNIKPQETLQEELLEVLVKPQETLQEKHSEVLVKPEQTLQEKFFQTFSNAMNTPFTMPMDFNPGIIQNKFLAGPMKPGITASSVSVSTKSEETSPGKPVITASAISVTSKSDENSHGNPVITSSVISIGAKPETSATVLSNKPLDITIVKDGLIKLNEKPVVTTKNPEEQKITIKKQLENQSIIENQQTAAVLPDNSETAISGNNPVEDKSS